MCIAIVSSRIIIIIRGGRRRRSAGVREKKHEGPSVNRESAKLDAGVCEKKQHYGQPAD